MVEYERNHRCGQRQCCYFGVTHKSREVCSPLLAIVLILLDTFLGMYQDWVCDEIQNHKHQNYLYIIDFHTERLSGKIGGLFFCTQSLWIDYIYRLWLIQWNLNVTVFLFFLILDVFTRMKIKDDLVVCWQRLIFSWKFHWLYAEKSISEAMTSSYFCFAYWGKTLLYTNWVNWRFTYIGNFAFFF